ncbi:MAG: hypothetical protein ACRCZK_03780 [Oscillospiraceae bacterium]
MKNNICQLISLSKRAGFLVAGFDMVENEATLNNKGVLLITNDVSTNTLKKMTQIIKNLNLRFINLSVTKEDINNLIGKYAGLLYINNEGMADKIIKVYDMNKEEDNSLCL